jgi:hypothetical protein
LVPAQRFEDVPKRSSEFGTLFFRVPDREILKEKFGNFTWARDKDDRHCGDKQAGVAPTLVAVMRGFDQWSLLKLISVQLVSWEANCAHPATVRLTNAVGLNGQS